MHHHTKLILAIVLLAAGAWFIGCPAQSYVKGEGAAKAEPEKVTQYRKACEGGDMQGCAYLGWIYDKGEGVAKNEQEAQRLYRKACNGGLSSVCIYVK